MTAGTHPSINRTARLAGGLYLAMMPFSAFGILYVPSVLIAPGDAAATARNIMASAWMFRGGTVGHLIGQVALLPLGLLVFRSGFLPRLLGILLLIGGVGYVIESATELLFPGLDVTVSQFTFVGELLLPMWLLIRGVNVDRWQRHAGSGGGGVALRPTAATPAQHPLAWLRPKS